MEIRHDERKRKFFADVEGKECALMYKKMSEKLWYFENLRIPRNASKRGVVDKIIEYAIDFVQDHDIKILVSSVDVQNFLIEHKDRKDIVYHPY